MIEVLEKDKAINTLNNYFSLLQSTGYVKHSATARFLMYMFIVDFVEQLYDLITECDYNIIRDALLKLFSTGCCLLPYAEFSSARTKIGEPTHSRIFSVRVTEENSWHRITEDERFRTP